MTRLKTRHIRKLYIIYIFDKYRFTEEHTPRDRFIIVMIHHIHVPSSTPHTTTVNNDHIIRFYYSPQPTSKPLDGDQIRGHRQTELTGFHGNSTIVVRIVCRRHSQRPE